MCHPNVLEVGKAGLMGPVPIFREVGADRAPRSCSSTVEAVFSTKKGLRFESAQEHISYQLKRCSGIAQLAVHLAVNHYG